MKTAADELVKENFIFRNPTGYGLHVSLNHEKAVEIKKMVAIYVVSAKIITVS